MNIWVIHLVTATVPIFVFWLAQRVHANEQHRQNNERLTRIETQLEPIWRWFNNGRSEKK